MYTYIVSWLVIHATFLFCLCSCVYPHTYHSPVDLEAIVPPFESHVCFAVRFPEGSHVEECKDKAVELPCLLEFSSNEPLSRADNLVFCDQNSGKRCVRSEITGSRILIICYSP